MYNTLALFALFALFTTGSAAGADGCADGASDDDKFCKKADGGKDYIGTCTTSGADSSCTLKNCSSPAVKDDPCGDDKTFSGNCESDTGRCLHTTFVKIEYTAKAPAASVADVAELMDANAFASTYVDAMSRYSKSPVRACFAKNFDIKISSLKVGELICGVNALIPCEVKCIDKYGKTAESNYKCNTGTNSKTWAGSAVGMCAKRCPVAVPSSGTSTEGTNNSDGSITFTKGVTGGVLQCPSVFEGGARCSLTCPHPYRLPSTLSTVTFGCSDKSNVSTWVWSTGTEPACEVSTDLKGSVRLSTKSDETASSLMADTGFVESFQDAVIKNNPTLGKHHVSITNIGTVTRRLNELPGVQVDYSFLVDPESATELDKVDDGSTNSTEHDGRLPQGDGGGLRGIR